MDQKKTSIVSALEVLESIKISLYKNDANDDKNHLRHISALTNIKETENNMRSSIIEQHNLEICPPREIIEEPEKEALSKELIKSNSIEKETSFHSKSSKLLTI